LFRHRPASVPLRKSAGAAMALQSPAKMKRPNLHAELLAEVAADLFRRRIAEPFYSTKRCVA
jgi:hypothetical protein